MLSNFTLSSRNDARQIATFEASVNIDHGNVGRAAIEHTKQCGHTTKVGTVPYACRHGDHWRRDVAANDTRQGALHPRDDYQGIPVEERVEMCWQTMRTGHADVTHQLDLDRHPP